METTNSNDLDALLANAEADRANERARLRAAIAAPLLDAIHESGRWWSVADAADYAAQMTEGRTWLARRELAVACRSILEAARRRGEIESALGPGRRRAEVRTYITAR